MAEIDLPYGNGLLPINIADTFLGEVVSPHPVRAASDPEEVIQTALAKPIGTPPLEQLVKKGQRVSVIIDDKLSICAELESEMEHIKGTYQCEWKTTIEDPVRSQRFSHYLNSDMQDSNVIFVREREQIRPARDEEKEELLIG